MLVHLSQPASQPVSSLNLRARAALQGLVSKTHLKKPKTEVYIYQVEVKTVCGAICWLSQQAAPFWLTSKGSPGSSVLSMAYGSSCFSLIDQVFTKHSRISCNFGLDHVLLSEWENLLQCHTIVSEGHVPLSLPLTQCPLGRALTWLWPQLCSYSTRSS